MYGGQVVVGARPLVPDGTDGGAIVVGRRDRLALVHGEARHGQAAHYVIERAFVEQ